MYRFVKICGIAALMVGVSLSAYGQHSGKGSSRDKDGNAEEVTVTAQGQQVAKDSDGKLRQPTPEEAKQLSDSLRLNDTVEGLTASTTADGVVKVDLQERFQNFAMAKKNADGSVSAACVQSSKEAEAFLKSKKSSQESAKQAKPAAAKKNVDNSGLEVK